MGERFGLAFPALYAGVFKRPENEPHCIGQSICPPFADRFFRF